MGDPDARSARRCRARGASGGAGAADRRPPDPRHGRARRAGVGPRVRRGSGTARHRRPRSVRAVGSPGRPARRQPRRRRHGRRARDRALRPEGGGARVRHRAGCGIRLRRRLHARGRRDRVPDVPRRVQPRGGRRPGVRRPARPVPGRDRARPHLAHHDHRRRRPHGPRLRGAVMDGDLLHGPARGGGSRPDGHAGALRRRGESHRGRHVARAAHHRGGRVARRPAAHGHHPADRRSPHDGRGHGALLEHRPRRVRRRRDRRHGPRRDRRRHVGRARQPVRRHRAGQGRGAAVDRRARRVLPPPADPADEDGCLIPALLVAHRARTGVHGDRERRRRGARPHAPADELRTARDPHPLGDPHRRRRCRPS